MIDKKTMRQEIDATDEELLALINQRLKLAQTIGEIKNRQDLATLDPKREQEVLDHLRRFNDGPLS